MPIKANFYKNLVFIACTVFGLLAHCTSQEMMSQLWKQLTGGCQKGACPQRNINNLFFNYYYLKGQ